MSRVPLIVVFSMLALTSANANAQLSRQELLDLVADGSDVATLVEQVERQCIDFDLDSHTLLDLAGTVPHEVLDVAIACRERHTETSLGCLAYRALTGVPELKGFPVVVKVRGSRVDLLVAESGVWIEENDVGLKGTFKAIREHGRKVRRIEEIVSAIGGVERVEVVRSSSFSLSRLKTEQQRGIAASCSVRSRLTIVSDPEGATVVIDGRRRGRTPLELSMPGGTYRLRLEQRGYGAHSEELRLADGVTRTLEVELLQHPRIEIASEPAGAVVVLDGKIVGRTPLEVTTSEGPRRLELVKPHFAPYGATISALAGETRTLTAALLASSKEEYCYAFSVEGNLENGLDALRSTLVSTRMRAAVPLYQVVTSTMESRLAATHVVDGDVLLFAPRYSDKYADRPSRLVGRELGGIAFGETATRTVSTPAGLMIVRGVERKKSKVKIELLAESGGENAVFLDFTRPPKQVAAQEVIDALCVIFSRHPGFEPTNGPD